MEVVLDRCLDSLLAGNDWTNSLPVETEARAELAGLIDVARMILRTAALTPQLHSAQRARIWRNVEARTLKASRIRAIAFYRLPHLPALWIRPEAC